MKMETFARPIGRALIEATDLAEKTDACPVFARPIGRALIEAQGGGRGGQLEISLHGQLAVPSLKREEAQ